MTTGHVFIASSLDGFIARRDGDIEWLDKVADDTEDNGYDEFIASVDGLIMGRNSFEKVLSFGIWPYTKPVVVLSRSLSAEDIPQELAEKARISPASPVEIMTELASEGWKRAYVDGGKVIQSFLREGLILDMKIFQIPILLGEGIPLFGPVADDILLEHVRSIPYPSGIVLNEYCVLKGQS